MYAILKNLILMKDTSKEVLEEKIWTTWASGRLTNEEKDELLQLVFENLNPEAEAPEIPDLYQRLEKKVNDLTARVEKLEGGSSGTDPKSPATTVPAWEAWDGISNNYQYGAAVAHSDRYWLNVLQGTQNVWEPGVADERYWKEISKEDAEAIISGAKTVDQVLNPTTEVDQEG